MQKIRSFIKTTILGGLVVILPVTIVAAVFTWLYRKVTAAIQPLTDLVMAKSHVRELVADLAVITAIALICFFVGLVVRTGVGRFIHHKLEDKVLAIAPGYNIVRETVAQFLGRKKSPFSSVAMVRLFESPALATAFVTDEHAEGFFTVFIPTGPNPTSGQIFHLPADRVQVLEVGVDETMRAIISCGAGSGKLIAAFRGATEPSPAES